MYVNTNMKANPEKNIGHMSGLLKNEVLKIATITA
jgi:hypothetical protein